MIIKNIKFKNFRSYGHIEQSIDFNDNGELIAVVGESGSGKTVIKEVFEFLVFGKIRSRRNPDKYCKLKNVPNRRNRNLTASIEILKNDKNLLIERGLNPSYFKVKYGNKTIEDNKQIIIERVLGITQEIYHSFISFGQSDVLNFISLSKKDADNVVNKLFSYEYVLGLSKKIEDLKHHNGIEKQKKDLEKSQLTKDLNKTLKKIEVINNNKGSIEKNDIIKNKKLYDEFITEQKDYLELEKKLEFQNNDLLKSYYEYQASLKDLNEKIDLYNTGVCPYCNSEIKDSKSLKNNLEIKKVNVKEKVDDINKTLTLLRTKIQSLKSDKNVINDKINKVLVDTKTIKKSIEIQNKIALVNYEEILENKKSFKDSIIDIDSKIKQHTNKNIIYNDLQEMLSLQGDLKREVLKKALPKINSNIQKIVEELDFEYELFVEDNLKVTMSEYGTKIDIDDPSNGEIKRANLIIMFSFMMYSSLKSKLNFMFLDELLEGLDIKNTKKILNTLKHVTHDMNINMFLICHKLKDLSQFNTIINVEKSYFSRLSISKNNI